MILNNKKKNIQEGFTQCEYRKKQNTGSMCKEKWGEPICNEWKPIGKVKKMKESEDKVEMIPLRGYQTNSFMYGADYEEEEEEEEGGEGEEEGGEGKKKKNDIPRGVHSSFFS